MRPCAAFQKDVLHQTRWLLKGTAKNMLGPWVKRSEMTPKGQQLFMERVMFLWYKSLRRSKNGCRLTPSDWAMEPWQAVCCLCINTGIHSVVFLT